MSDCQKCQHCGEWAWWDKKRKAYWCLKCERATHAADVPEVP